MVTIELDPETQEYLDRRKQLLLEQARVLCEAYDAGTLKKLLADFKGKTSDSHQPHPQQPTAAGLLEPAGAGERSER